MRGEGTAHKLGWAPSKPFSCQIWKHLHTILKSNLEFLIHGGNRLSYSIWPAINLPLAGEVCRRLEALALKEATFQFFLFNCKWLPAYVSLALHGKKVHDEVFVKEDDDMTEEMDRKVKIEEPQNDNRSGDLRQHSMIYICVLMSLLAVLGLLVY